MPDDYVIRWRPVTSSWREVRGFSRESAETALEISRQCQTGPLPLEVVYPDGEHAWRDHRNEYPYA